MCQVFKPILWKRSLVIQLESTLFQNPTYQQPNIASKRSIFRNGNFRLILKRQKRRNLNSPFQEIVAQSLQIGYSIAYNAALGVQGSVLPRMGICCHFSRGIFYIPCWCIKVRVLTERGMPHICCQQIFSFCRFFSSLLLFQALPQYWIEMDSYEVRVGIGRHRIFAFVLSVCWDLFLHMSAHFLSVFYLVLILEPTDLWATLFLMMYFWIIVPVLIVFGGLGLTEISFLLR